MSIQKIIQYDRIDLLENDISLLNTIDYLIIDENKPLLINAIENRSVYVSEYLIDNIYALNDIKYLNQKHGLYRDGNSMNALMYACKYYLYRIVEKLIELGVDINIIDNFGENALFFSCYYNKYDHINKLLIDAGINVNQQNKYGDTILHLICRKNKLTLLKYLIN